MKPIPTLLCRCGKPASRDHRGTLACNYCRGAKRRARVKKAKDQENQDMLEGIFPR